MTVERALGVVCLLAVLFPAAARADDDVEVSREKQSWYLGEAARVEVDLTIGSLAVHGSDGRDVEAELALWCSPRGGERCREQAQKVHLSPRVSGSTFEVRLKNTPRGRIEGIRAELTVRIPRRLPLEIDQRGGDVSVDGMAAGLEIDAAFGSVHVAAEQQGVRRVSVKVGVGKADLWVAGSHVRGSGFPRSIDWTGAGESTVEIDLGTGDAVVDLR